MKALILNQAFYPDVVSSAQHAADLAVALAEKGHDVTVVASWRAYDSPQKTFPPSEVWRGVKIFRVRSTAFGKKALWRRALDFSSFYWSCILRLTTLPRFDVVIAMTAPPLMSVVAAVYARITGAALVSWVMDLNPDEAIAAGVLSESSVPARVLDRLLRFSLVSSGAIVVMDRFMRDRIVAKRISAGKVFIIPPWSHSAVVHYDAQARTEFRTRHGLMGKFVVMYSGNHSPCHPLETLLAAAQELASEPSIAFLFVGGGSRFSAVREFALEHGLENIYCLPYQPLEMLAGSLSAADLHVVVMGDKFVGTVHPCKIYNILAIGSPFLYIGPGPNHITELAEAACAESAYFAHHGEAGAVSSHILQAAGRGPIREAVHVKVAENFSDVALVPLMISVIERCVDPSLAESGSSLADEVASRVHTQE